MPTVDALAPWKGSNRMLACKVADRLRGLKWLGIPFAGGMSELSEIKCRTILVNDKHRHVINLAQVVSHAELGPRLREILEDQLFHPIPLKRAQEYCSTHEPNGEYDLEAATHYFIAVWMNRSGKAGTKDEFKGQLPIRWTSSGGDSNKRYRSAVESIDEWRQIFSVCNFTMLDCFEFIKNVRDEDGHGLYCDSPFWGPGDAYLHTFTEQQHRDWAKRLRDFKSCRVVVRFYDVPLVRELYPEDLWTWNFITGGRDQANQEKPEVLLINKRVAA